MVKHFYCLSVPNWSTLERDTDGNKVARDMKGNLLPNAKPNIKWSSQAQATKDTPVMLAHCGKSNIIAIDWDGQEGERYFNDHLVLDPHNPLITKGVGKEGGHFIYNDTLTEDGPLATALHNMRNRVSIAKTLDILQGTSLVYLPTPENKTKEILAWDPAQIKPMPLSVEYMLASLINKNKQPKQMMVPLDAEASSALYGYILAKEDLPIEKLMEQLTPNRVRQLFKENSTPNRPGIEQRYHPDNLPMDANAQDYLHSISTTLAMDSSVSEEVYRHTLNRINISFSEPKSQSDVDAITNYAITGEQINGKKMWRYNPDWETQGMTYLDTYNHTHEIFYAKPITGTEDIYIDYNHNTLSLHQFKNKTKLVEYIVASLPVGSSRRNVSLLNKSIGRQIHSTQLISEPLQDFGPFQLSDKHVFNVFHKTPELQVLHSAEKPADYKHPSLTLHMLNNVVGQDEEKLERLLKFYRRKFTTYDHSPQIHIFWGVPGSGKSSVYQGIFAPLMPNDRLLIAPATSSGDQFNSQLKNKDVVCVDEIHTLQKSNRKLLDIIVAQANAISGQDTLRGLRAMQTVLDSTPVRHSITFGFTCNAPVQLIEETRDRRTVVYHSTLSFSAYMAENDLGYTDAQVKATIADESLSFAYYLATEVSNATDDEYYSNKLEKDTAYKTFYSAALPLVKKIGLAKLHPETLLDILKEAQLYNEKEFIAACKIPQRKTYVQVCMLNIGTSFEEPKYPGLLDRVADAREYRTELGESALVNEGADRRIVITLNYRDMPMELLRKIASSQKDLAGTKIEKFILVNEKD